MSVDSVELADDYRSIDVTVTFANQSDERLRIHVLETGIRLSGRSISGGSDRYDNLVLDPGERVTLSVTSQINRLEADFLNDRLSNTSNLRWNVSGRVSVSVENLSEDLWLPFRSNLDVEL